jgi:hypothetical protein
MGSVWFECFFGILIILRILIFTHVGIIFGKRQDRFVSHPFQFTIH